jgi:spermidine synthase
MRTILRFAAALLAAALALTVPPVPSLLIAYGRYAAVLAGRSKVIYAAEGVTASVAVSRTEQGVVLYHNAGKTQASSLPQDMRLQRMLGHITTLSGTNPGRVLVIGCGAGVTAGAVSIDPRVKQETIAEIEPRVPEIAARFFGDHNFNVISNPKVKVHLDDARHYLLTTDEKFDAITSDPLDAWVKGSATLHTREFFQELKRHLNPGGVVTIWVQLYENTEAAVKSELATFFEAFPEGAIFANTVGGLGYDLVLFGHVEGGPINITDAQRRLEDPANVRMAESLREINILSAVTLFGTYAGNRSDLQEWLKGAVINTDGNLRLQYLAGLGASANQSVEIYREMTGNVRYPEQLFVGEAETIGFLRSHIEANIANRAAFAAPR